MQREDLYDGQVVQWDAAFSGLTGEKLVGRVKGLATSDFPIMGAMVIVECETIKTPFYPFSSTVVPAIALKAFP